MEDKREPQCIPGGGLLEPSPGICYLLPVSLSSPPLPVGRGCEVAASCFAHLEDQLWFFTHIFLQLRVSRRDVLMITGQAAASPQLPLVLTSRGCSRALEGHLCEADAAKAAWEEATMPCRSNSCLPAPAPKVGYVWGGGGKVSSSHALLQPAERCGSAASPISLHISCSFLCR